MAACSLTTASSASCLRTQPCGGLSGRSIRSSSSRNCSNCCGASTSIRACAAASAPSATQRTPSGISTSITRSTCVLAASRPTRILATDAYRPGGVRTRARAGIRTLNEVGGPSRSTGTTTSRQPRSARTISASREFSVDRASSSTWAMRRPAAPAWSPPARPGRASVSSRSRSRRWASCSRLPRAAAPVGLPAGGGSSGPAGCGSRRASTAASSTCRSRVAWPASAEPRRCSRTTSVSASAAASCRLTSACGTSAIRAPALSVTSTLTGTSASGSGPTLRGSASSGSQSGPSRVRSASCAM